MPPLNRYPSHISQYLPILGSVMKIARLLLWLLLAGNYGSAFSSNSLDLLSAVPLLARDGELAYFSVHAHNTSEFMGIGIFITYPEGLVPTAKLARFRLLPVDALDTAIYEVGEKAPEYWVAGGLIRSERSGYVDLEDIVFEVPFTGRTTTGPKIFQMMAHGELNFAGPAFDLRTITSTFTVLPKGESGDVNGDGQVTPGDVQWVIRKYIGAVEFSPQVMQSADVYPANGDGTITLDDAITLLRLSVGIQ
jgi:hypothetical protein